MAARSNSCSSVLCFTRSRRSRKVPKLSADLVFLQTGTGCNLQFNSIAKPSLSSMSVVRFRRRQKDQWVAGRHGRLPNELNKSRSTSPGILHFKTPMRGDAENEAVATLLRSASPRPLVRLRETDGMALPVFAGDPGWPHEGALVPSDGVPRRNPFSRQMFGRERSICLLHVADGAVSFFSLTPGKLGRNSERPRNGQSSRRNHGCRKLQRRSASLIESLRLICTDFRQPYACCAVLDILFCCVKRERDLGIVGCAFSLLRISTDMRQTPMLRNFGPSSSCTWRSKFQRDLIDSLSEERQVPQWIAFLRHIHDEGPAIDVFRASSTRFSLLLLPRPVAATPAWPPCATLQLGSSALAQEIPVQRESRIQSNPPADDCCPWPHPPIVVHPVRPTDEGDHIRQMNGDETLGRMLGICRHGSARQGFFALSTEQASGCSRDESMDGWHEFADVNAKWNSTRLSGNHTQFKKLEIRWASWRQL
jgi:hypothetical protein